MKGKMTTVNGSQISVQTTEAIKSAVLLAVDGEALVLSPSDARKFAAMLIEAANAID